MKKGDLVQKRIVYPPNSPLGNSFDSEGGALASIEFFQKTYGIEAGTAVTVIPDTRFPDTFCLSINREYIVIHNAKVNWIVGDEVALEFPNGGCSILNLKEPENEGWVVVQEAAPEYQTSVEHMTDEQLRNSIDELRMRRISQPARTRVTKVSAPKMTEEEKKLNNVLKGKSPEQLLELQRKLGLID